ncbi:MAG: FMN-binding negative transcriptional regulator [Heliomarina sp.]|uniref:FMN-binding negative transcriptional regulator n=1 Tax=Heliomarina sp. TaxID=2917556 RepID=UPI00405A3F0D
MTQSIRRPYVPAPYRMGEDAARAMILSEPFSLLVTQGEAGITEATHTPLYFENGQADCGTLVGHITRANPQAASVGSETQALAVFTGPSAYVSPAWYVEDEDVPTWIYQSVQVRGPIEVIETEEEMMALMLNIVSQSERRIGGTWQLDRIEQRDIDRMMHRIVGFRIHIETVVGVSKVEQTRSAANRAAVAAQLEGGREIGRDPLRALLGVSQI